MEEAERPVGIPPDDTWVDVQCREKTYYGIVVTYMQAQGSWPEQVLCRLYPDASREGRGWLEGVQVANLTVVSRSVPPAEEPCTTSMS